MRPCPTVFHRQLNPYRLPANSRVRITYLMSSVIYLFIDLFIFSFINCVRVTHSLEYVLIHFAIDVFNNTLNRARMKSIINQKSLEICTKMAEKFELEIQIKISTNSAFI